MEIDIYGEYIDLVATKYVLNYLYMQQHPKNFVGIFCDKTLLELTFIIRSRKQHK